MTYEQIESGLSLYTDITFIKNELGVEEAEGKVFRFKRLHSALSHFDKSSADDLTDEIIFIMERKLEEIIKQKEEQLAVI